MIQNVDALIRLEILKRTRRFRLKEPYEYEMGYESGTKSPARIEQIVRRALQLSEGEIVSAGCGCCSEIVYKTDNEILAIILKEINGND